MVPNITSGKRESLHKNTTEKLRLLSIIMHTFTIFLFWAFISTLNTPLRPKPLFAHKLLLMGVEIYRDAYLSETPSMIPCPTFTVKQATFVN